VPDDHTDNKKTDEQVVLESAKPKGDGTHMHVKVYAPFKVYFDDEALSISAINDTGPFDVLPQHHNFMTLLSPCDIIVRTERGEEKITINRGIMHVKADDVVVFLDV
jgi:F0F1-type ATP synthase epsilon subunit